jgi:hypothetical protein
MFGFGMVLMRLVDYLTQRKYNKEEEKKEKIEETWDDK